MKTWLSTVNYSNNPVGLSWNTFTFLLSIWVNIQSCSVLRASQLPKVAYYWWAKPNWCRVCSIGFGAFCSEVSIPLSGENPCYLFHHFVSLWFVKTGPDCGNSLSHDARGMFTLCCRFHYTVCAEDWLVKWCKHSFVVLFSHLNVCAFEELLWSSLFHDILDSFTWKFNLKKYSDIRFLHRNFYINWHCKMCGLQFHIICTFPVWCVLDNWRSVVLSPTQDRACGTRR